MARYVLKRLLAVALTLVLALGQGVIAPAVAASMSEQSHIEMLGSGFPDNEQDNCCPACDHDHDADHGVKGSVCAAMCSAMAHAALLAQSMPFVRHAARIFYDIADTAAYSRSLLPASPPPKA